MLSLEEAEKIEASIIETINERATELRQLIITIGSIIAILMPAVEMVGILDLTPYGKGDDEWVGDEDWEWGDDFECGDGSTIQASLVNDGYRNCRDGSDEPEEEYEELDDENNTVILPNQGCTDYGGLHYDVEAEEHDGSCEYGGVEAIPGCTDENATNYNSGAEEDDGSCEYGDENEIPEDCYPDMWDAYYDYDNETENMTLIWDADLTCDDAPYNLTVIWTFYHNTTNETGEWAEIQESLTYETYHQDWDYVNLTISGVPAGRYDIFSTFGFNDEYSRGTDWFGVVIE